MNINEILRQAARDLEDISETPSLDARVLLCEVYGVQPIYLISHGRDEVSEEIERKFNELMDMRKANMPVAYILRKKEFMSMDFFVDERVLIPRSDTENLVEKAVSIIGEKEVSVLDMCCGSGCIGLSVKKYCPNIFLTLADISAAALEVATINASHHFGEDSNISIIQTDIFENITEKYDFILSNPPYISYEEMKTLSKDILDYEPHNALEAENEGLYFYEEITKRSLNHLKVGGYLIYEIGYLQAEAVKNILASYGFTDIEILKDLSGLDRVVTGKLS